MGSLSLVFFLMFRPPPGSTLFPYTTLFRSRRFTRLTFWRRRGRARRRLHTARSQTRHCPGTQQVTQRSEEHTSELQSQFHLVCRLLLEKKNYALANPGKQFILTTPTQESIN